MRAVRSLVAAAAIALAGAAGCQAKLEGAHCPCIEPTWTCNVDLDLCVPTDQFRDTDAAPDVPDAGLFPDAGFFPDGSFLPDSGPGSDAGI